VLEIVPEFGDGGVIGGEFGDFAVAEVFHEALVVGFGGGVATDIGEDEVINPLAVGQSKKVADFVDVISRPEAEGR